MQNSRSTNRRLKFAWLLGAVVSGFSSAHAGDALPQYTAQMYPFTGGSGVDQPRRLNDAGMAAGGSFVKDETGASVTPVRWRLDGGEFLHPLTYPGRAYGINNHGAVVGDAFMETTTGFIWEDGIARQLDGLGGIDVFPYAINDDGLIAGASYTADGAFRPVQWIDDVPSDLAVDPAIASGAATSLNAAGRIVGWADRPGTNTAAITWFDGVEEWIEAPVAADSSLAMCINDLGIVGGSFRPSGEFKRACYWTRDPGTGNWTRHDIADDLPMAHSVVMGISNDGVIIGHMGFTEQGFIWHDGVGASLDSRLIDPKNEIGVPLAWDINAHGEILCEAFDIAGLTGTRTYRLVPFVAVPCPADLDDDGAVGFTDLVALLGNWGGAGTGDLDGNGAVTLTDLLSLLAAWGPCDAA